MVRKVFLWAALGVLVVFFLGPVLAVVLTLLPFVVLGFALWLPLHLLTDARSRAAWPRWHRVGEQCRQAVGAWGKASAAAVRRTCEAGESLRAAGRTFRTFALETFSGAAVGLLLGLLSGLDHARSEPPPAAVVGLLLGGLVGVLVALSRLRAAAPARGCGP